MTSSYALSVESQKRLQPIVKMHMEAFNDPSHDFSHIERVALNAMTIISSENCTEEEVVVIIMSIMLHDMFDHKYYAEKNGVSQGDRVREVLNQNNADRIWSENIINRVCRTINLVSFSKGDGLLGAATEEKKDVELPLEIRIVQDADRLDAMGAIGIMRAFAFGGKRGRPLYTEAEITHVTDLDSPNVLTVGNQDESGTLGHFWDKLLRRENVVVEWAANH